MQAFPYSKSEWKIYGNFKRSWRGLLFVHPLRPWWILLEFYTLIGLGIFIFEYEKFEMWQLVIVLAVGFMCLLASWKTTLCDPGVVPRPSFDEAFQNYKNIQQNPAEFRNKIVQGKGTPPTQYIHTYCHRCNNYRPPKTGHCSICDCCIQNWDHHCPVFGGCVGYKNKSWFYWMVATIPVFWTVLLIFSAMSALSDSRAWYTNITLCCSLTGFIGAIILPPILSCRSCDRVHRGLWSGAGISNYFDPLSVPKTADYPRQPPAVVFKEEKNEGLEKNANNKQNKETDDNNNNQNDVTVNFSTI